MVGGALPEGPLRGQRSWELTHSRVPLTIDCNEMVYGERFSVHGVRPIVVDPLGYETPLKDAAGGWREYGLLRDLVTD